MWTRAWLRYWNQQCLNWPSRAGQLWLRMKARWPPVRHKWKSVHSDSVALNRRIRLGPAVIFGSIDVCLYFLWRKSIQMIMPASEYSLRCCSASHVEVNLGENSLDKRWNKWIRSILSLVENIKVFELSPLNYHRIIEEFSFLSIFTSIWKTTD